MPCMLDFEQTELVVFHDISKKPSSTKGRKNAISNRKGNNEGENETKYSDDEENKANEMEDKKNVGLGIRFVTFMLINGFCIFSHILEKS